MNTDQDRNSTFCNGQERFLKDSKTVIELTWISSNIILLGIEAKHISRLLEVKSSCEEFAFTDENYYSCLFQSIDMIKDLPDLFEKLRSHGVVFLWPVHGNFNNATFIEFIHLKSRVWHHSPVNYYQAINTNVNWNFLNLWRNMEFYNHAWADICRDNINNTFNICWLWIYWLCDGLTS